MTYETNWQDSVSLPQEFTKQALGSANLSASAVAEHTIDS